MSTDLVSTAEIAERMGVTRPAVANWKARAILPRPIVQLACGPIWEWSDVRRAMLLTGRVDGIDRASAANAEALLAYTRERCRKELSDQLDQLDALLFEPLAPPSRGYRGGEYDFLDRLSTGEKLSLRRNAFKSGGLEPDVWARVNGFHDNVGEAMDAWLRAVRLSSAIRRHKYFGLQSSDGLELEKLFGTDGLAYLAMFYVDEAADHEVTYNTPSGVDLGEEMF